MVNLNLSSGNSKTTQALYSTWKNQLRGGFFTVSNEIIDYLKLIKTPAINLYLFYAAKAKNSTGVSMWSNERIADELKVSTKTITNWNSQLENAGLIIRKPRANTSTITQLRPLSDFFVESKNEKETKEWIKLLNSIGFNEKDCIVLNLVDGFIYYQFQQTFYKDFKEKENGVTRTITIKSSSKDETISNDISADKQMEWFKKNDYLIGVNSTVEFVKQSSKNLDSEVTNTFKQIREHPAEFKSTYSEYLPTK